MGYINVIGGFMRFKSQQLLNVLEFINSIVRFFGIFYTINSITVSIAIPQYIRLSSMSEIYNKIIESLPKTDIMGDGLTIAI